MMHPPSTSHSTLHTTASESHTETEPFPIQVPFPCVKLCGQGRTQTGVSLLSEWLSLLRWYVMHVKCLPVIPQVTLNQ